ncbi:MAG: hypothetical protein DHS20C18_01650 [Saprospiraceae bacterium]|nr:MAG: hypothetical protein DHS20C18_01650 [Saprospiraceae bacterium]
MCRQHRYSHSFRRNNHRTVGEEKIKFYRNLRSFIAFTIIVPAIWLVTGSFIGLWKISIIWGIILFVKSIKLFGVPGTGGWLSRDFEDWQAERKNEEPLEDFDTRPKAEPLFDQGHWRERDLV